MIWFYHFFFCRWSITSFWAWVKNRLYCQFQSCKFSKLNQFHSKFYFISLLFRLPFDWKTPFGYLIALLAEFATVHSSSFLFSPVASFFIGSAWLLICFIQDITSDLADLNVITTSIQSLTEMKKRLCYIVGFYSDKKQLNANPMNLFLTIEFNLFAFTDWSMSSAKSMNLLYFLCSCGHCYRSQVYCWYFYHN